MLLSFISASEVTSFPHRSTGKKKSCCTLGPELCIRYRTSTAACSGCRSIFSVSFSIMTSVCRFLSEALMLPVSRTPVCQAPPLPKRVDPPPINKASASHRFLMSDFLTCLFAACRSQNDGCATCVREMRDGGDLLLGRFFLWIAL